MNMLICDCNIWLKLQASGFWKHLAFAIIMDEIELPPDDDGLDELPPELELPQDDDGPDGPPPPSQ